MPLTKIQFRPGINRESTSYAAEGGWFDCDKVRFRAGMPEKIGGWQRATAQKFLGSCRSMHEWAALDSNSFLSLGTHLKFYVMWGSSYYDITPIRVLRADMPDNPFTTAAESGFLVVHHPDHLATIGDFVVFEGATAAFDPFPSNPDPHPTYTAAVLNREYQITEIVDNDHYKIYTGIPSEAAGMPAGGMGGTLAVATYQIHTGLDVAVPGTGWGAPPWGGLPLAEGGGDPVPPNPTAPPHKGGWGMPYYVFQEEGSVPTNQIRLWAQDNFGEDLLFNIRGGAVFYWKRTSGVNSRAVELKDVVPPLGVTVNEDWIPRWAFETLVSEVDRHAIAVGTNDVLQDFLDPMLIRWSTAENVLDWEPRRNNSAGSLRLSSGSRLRGVLRTRQEILIWTDKNLQSMRFIGSPYWFGLNLIAENVSTLCPSAAINAGGRVFWMDRNGFYTYAGQVQELPCTVRDYVFSDFNIGQSWKVTAGHNHNFQEVTWFYPTADSQENNRYVMYNYVENAWSYGTLTRTCWLDQVWADSFPVATGKDGVLYHHEKGDDDGDDPMGAWVESTDVTIQDGDRYMFIRRLVPDFAFRGSSDRQAVGVSVRMRQAPGAFFTTEVRASVNPYTKYNWIRARGRQMVVRIESSEKGTGWRAGALRFEMQADGKR